MSSLSRPEDHRRKWDRDEYEKLAQERLRKERGEESSDDEEAELKKLNKEKAKREFLKPREHKVNLESKVGKSVVITKTTPAAEAGGYYCDVCDCVVKDSINYLDHINGKKHQKNMGMSMRVKTSTLDDVKARFATKRKETEEKLKSYDMEERMRELQEEEQKLAEYKKQKKQDQKKRKLAPTDDEPVDSDLAALMGFGGFGTSKK